MMRTRPSVAHGARASARVLGEVVRTWPSSVRGHMPTQVLGEIVLAALLVAALAFSPRDGVASDDNVAWPTESSNRLSASTLEPPSIGLTLPGISNLSAWAKSTGALISENALIPTAPPVQLLIPSLRVHRPVEGVGTDRKGVLDLPVNAWNAAWYKNGPVPGAPGDAVIQGHAGYPDQPMLFGRLGTLRQGDKIIVVLADGSQRLFLVESMAVLPVGSAPPGMADRNGPPRLTLLTCTGHFDQNQKYYTQRLVLEASYAGTV